MFASKFEVRTKKVSLWKRNRSTDKQLFQLINCSKWCPLARTHALSLGRHWSMALSMTLCLNSAKNSCFKFLQGSVMTLFRWSWKILPYFVANLSKSLHINFYQNRLSIVEVMIKKFWCVFYASQCSAPLYSFAKDTNVALRHHWESQLNASQNGCSLHFLDVDRTKGESRCVLVQTIDCSKRSRDWEYNVQ